MVYEVMAAAAARTATRRAASIRLWLQVHKLAEQGAESRKILATAADVTRSQMQMVRFDAYGRTAACEAIFREVHRVLVCLLPLAPRIFQRWRLRRTSATTAQ